MSIWNESTLGIEKLNLSNRSYNCLKRNGINTIMELMLLSKEALNNFRNLGVKSVEEISKVINDLAGNNFIIKDSKNECKINKEAFKSPCDCLVIDCITGDRLKIIKVMFYDNKGILSDDLNINEMKLSVRSTKCLLNNGYTSVSQLLRLKKSELISIKNMGKKSVEEIFNKIADISYITYKDEEKNKFLNYDTYCNQIIHEYNNCSISFDIENMKSNTYMFLKKNKDFFKREVSTESNTITEFIKRPDILEMFYTDMFFRELIKTNIYTIISSANQSVSIHNVRQALPAHLRHSSVEKDIISEMINEKKLEWVDYNLRCWYPTILEYINSIKNEREKTILLNRIKGKTLEEIGSTLNITRERVRQIEKKVLKKIPRLREDDYKEVFEKYDWNLATFVSAYGENELTFKYLKTVYEKGENPLELFLTDDDISHTIRLEAEKIIYKDYIVIGSSRIKRERNEILDYILRTHCRNEVTIQELSNLYYDFLKSLGLYDVEEMIYPERYFETTLANSKKVLWKFGKKLRYYDFENIDFGQIIKELNLEQYTDVEYSTLKFFRDYPELMEECDIRDEYELHNLIKKKILDETQLDIKSSKMPNKELWDIRDKYGLDNPIKKKSLDETHLHVKLLKMPHIEFGIADRNMQVLNLMIQAAPIGNVELARLYEEEYGVKAETVLANYFKCIDEYYHKGVYSIDSEPLVGDEFDLMKKALINEFYFISDVKEIFNNMFPEGDITLINSYNLKCLGFKVNSNSIYSDKYTNCEQYFRTIILKNDIFDASTLSTKIYFNQTCYHVVQALREQYEIIEFSHNKFINIRRLEKIGVSKENLRDFGEAVFEFVGEEFFTIKSLKKRGFEHKLDELGFEDWFYDSLLKCDYRFKYRRLQSNVLFRKGKEVVTLNNLIEYLVLRFRSIDIYDFIDFIFEEYGIKIDSYKIQSIARESEMYYNPIMEKIYIDYDEYFEEV